MPLRRLFARGEETEHDLRLHRAFGEVYVPRGHGDDRLVDARAVDVEQHDARCEFGGRRGGRREQLLRLLLPRRIPGEGRRREGR